MEEWLDEIDGDLPEGLLEWSRGFDTLALAFAACPHAQWRLWLATYLATTDEEHRCCAQAALRVARALVGSLPAPQPLATRALELAERWAVTRSRDEGYEDAMQALDEACGASMPSLAGLVRSAVWFADFEACVGIDGACNVTDLFVDARALAQSVGGAAVEESLLLVLAEDLRTMLPMPQRARGAHPVDR